MIERINTPVNPGTIEKLRTDDLTGDLARAWNDAGSHPKWHSMAQQKVSAVAPALAAVISAIAKQHSQGSSESADILDNLMRATFRMWQDCSPSQQSEIHSAMPVVADCLTRIFY